MKNCSWTAWWVSIHINSFQGKLLCTSRVCSPVLEMTISVAFKYFIVIITALFQGQSNSKEHRPKVIEGFLVNCCFYYSLFQKRKKKVRLHILQHRSYSCLFYTNITLRTVNSNYSLLSYSCFQIQYLKCPGRWKLSFVWPSHCVLVLHWMETLISWVLKVVIQSHRNYLNVFLSLIILTHYFTRMPQGEVSGSEDF